MTGGPIEKINRALAGLAQEMNGTPEMTKHGGSFHNVALGFSNVKLFRKERPADWKGKYRPPVLKTTPAGSIRATVHICAQSGHLPKSAGPLLKKMLATHLHAQGLECGERDLKPIRQKTMQKKLMGLAEEYYGFSKNHRYSWIWSLKVMGKR